MPPLLLEVAAAAPADVYRRLDTSPQGLAEDEAGRRRQRHGLNAIAQENRYGRLLLLAKALLNPLVVLLLVLVAVSSLTGDTRAAVVMLLMVVLGVVLRFAQEARADAAAARLKAMIRVTATALRDGQPREVPLADLVPGDVVLLSTGDMIPADLRLVACKDLHVIQASLTGEAFPVEKADGPEAAAGRSPLEFKNLCFLGTSVETGTAQGVIVCTGRDTYLGGMASALVQQPEETSFDRGVRRFTCLMIRFIAVMVPLVLVVNGLTKHNWQEAFFFFALAVAVGLTPEMLPMFVTVCLSKGALLMSRRKVIVTSSGSSGRCRAGDTWSVSSATASTTRRRCGRPTSASRWTARWTSPRSRPTPSCWRRACWCWGPASSRGGRSSSAA